MSQSTTTDYIVQDFTKIALSVTLCVTETHIHSDLLQRAVCGRPGWKHPRQIFTHELQCNGAKAEPGAQIPPGFTPLPQTEIRHILAGMVGGLGVEEDAQPWSAVMSSANHPPASRG